MYVGTSDAYEILGYSIEGVLNTIVRRDLDRIPVTEKDRAEYLENEFYGKLDEQGGWRRRLRRVFLEMDYPSTMPAHGRLLVAKSDNLWVEYYRPAWKRESRWTVFNAQGRMLGDVDMPLDMEVLEIGSDYVLGLLKDELDVEYVQLYELIKP